MPFKSEAQRKKMAMLEAQGKVPKGTYAKWEAHTKEKSLPERVGSKRKTIKEMRKKTK